MEKEFLSFGSSISLIDEDSLTLINFSESVTDFAEIFQILIRQRTILPQ